MPDVVFYGSSKHIVLSEIGTYSTEDIYSQWKQWASQSENAGWPKAFDTIGGDAVGGNQEVAPYFFARNDLGWLVKMPSANGEIIISGNLFPRDPSQDMFIQAQGYDAFLRLEVSTRAVVITVPVETSTGGLTTAQDAKLNSLDTSVIDTKVDQVRANQEVINTGIQEASLLIPHLTNLP
ncbi:MAG: hypothetical protein P8P29_08770 [Flavobacteriaceae bacterium]|nr:hypothetical protein [Flavobacteriaceae bacterium]